MGCSLGLIVIWLGSGCVGSESRKRVKGYSPFLPEQINQERDSTKIYAVIEIPAGTNTPQSVDSLGEIRRGRERSVDFLPFPGNYGFIAGCGKRDTITGENKLLPVLVMMESAQSGSVLEIEPVAALVLGEGREMRPIIIAIPADSTLQTIRCRNFVDFMTEYEPARNILQQWFLNYRRHQTFGFTGWQDEHYARQLISASRPEE